MRCTSWYFLFLFPSSHSAAFPLRSPSPLFLLMHGVAKTRRAEICRLTMEGSCSGCVSLSGAELVVQAFFAPFPPPLPPSHPAHPDAEIHLLEGLGEGKTKHAMGFVCLCGGRRRCVSVHPVPAQPSQNYMCFPGKLSPHQSQNYDVKHLPGFQKSWQTAGIKLLLSGVCVHMC